jgi:predicted alpha/beta superfamily hydrolase
MHDGENVFNDSTSFAGRSWRASTTLDALAAEGVLPPLIVAALYNTADRMDDYTYSVCKPYGGGKGDLYLDFIEETALPAIAAAVPQASVSPATLGLAGSSLGGLITAYAGYTRPHVYATTISMSSSFWWNNQDFNNTVMRKWPGPADPSSTAHRFYLDSGNAGPGKDDVVETKVVVSHLQAEGFVANVSVFHYVDDGGQHSELYWGDRFHIPLRWLYGLQNL